MSERIESLERQIAADMSKRFHERITRLTALLAERDAEIARLREALSWYADERNYDVDDYDHEDVPGAMVNEDMRCSRCRLMGCGAYFEPDRGKRARAALAARGVTSTGRVNQY